ncbi:hypothetical protein [Methylomonas koyamae]|uniref:hypothetical protein n=1 Tax=Methylomonas koyamae TaxID=702114 RepID=UPI0011284481|nr:hypothetical protein [Methylomonas koyamae]
MELIQSLRLLKQELHQLDPLIQVHPEEVFIFAGRYSNDRLALIKRIIQSHGFKIEDTLAFSDPLKEGEFCILPDVRIGIRFAY